MRSALSFTIGGLMFLFASTSSLHAQEWKKVNPGMVKVLVDTTLVLAVEATIEPGKKSDFHTHSAHFFYALTDCKLIVHYADGKTENYNLKAGEFGYSAPEGLHSTENAGDKTARFLLVELKEHPYKSATMKK